MNPLEEIVEELKLHNTGLFNQIDSVEIKRMIVKITRVLPFFVRIVAMPKGNFIRNIAKKYVQIEAIDKAITEHFDPLLAK